MEILYVIEILHQFIFFFFKKKINYTPLHYAIKYKHHKIIDYLLSIDAYTFDEYDEFLSLIHLAASSGIIFLVKNLLIKGIDYSLSNHKNWDLLHFASSNGHSELLNIISPLINPEMFKNIDKNNRNLYHQASINGHLNVITFLDSLELKNYLNVDKYGVYFIF